MEEELEEKVPYWVGFMMVATGALLIAQSWPHGWVWRLTLGWIGAMVLIVGVMVISGRARGSN